jgi:hypothetical protein
VNGVVGLDVVAVVAVVAVVGGGSNDIVFGFLN